MEYAKIRDESVTLNDGGHIGWTTSHDAFEQMFFSWMRQMNDLDKERVTDILVTLFTEYQLAASITTKTEEERLAEANAVATDRLMEILVGATARATLRHPNGSLYAEVKDIYAVLEKSYGLRLPNTTVHTYLKTREHFTGTVDDVGEGFFRIIEPKPFVETQRKAEDDMHAILIRPHHTWECPSAGMFGVPCANCIEGRP